MMEVPEKRFKIVAKPNSRKNEIDYDPIKKSYVVRVKARAEDNMANVEIVRFLSKTFGRRARIISGFKSKNKIVELDQ